MPIAFDVRQVKMARSGAVDRYRTHDRRYISGTSPQGTTVSGDSEFSLHLISFALAHASWAQAHGVMATIITFLLIAVGIASRRRSNVTDSHQRSKRVWGSI